MIFSQNFWAKGTHKDINNCSKFIYSEDIPLNHFNGSEGVFLTYEDFLNDKPQKLSFEKWRFNTVGGVSNLRALFRDNEGKTIEYGIDKFWGFRGKKALYRNFPFETGGSHFLAFKLRYYAAGYYAWDAEDFDFMEVTPNRLYSNSVNGEGVPALAASLPGIDCANSAYVIENNLYIHWEESLQNLKKCKDVKFVLEQEYEGKSQKMYHKKNPDIKKEYIKIHM